MLSKIKDKIYLFFHLRSYKKAIKQANKLRSLTFKKHLVIAVKGEFKVLSRQRLKQLYAQGAFKRGLNFREIEKRVIYSTK